MMKELSKIDQRTDGEVEVIDVKLNNSKTKKIGGKKDEKSKQKIKSNYRRNIFIIKFKKLKKK